MGGRISTLWTALSRRRTARAVDRALAVLAECDAMLDMRVRKMEDEALAMRDAARLSLRAGRRENARFNLGRAVRIEATMRALYERKDAVQQQSTVLNDLLLNWKIIDSSYISLRALRVLSLRSVPGTRHIDEVNARIDAQLDATTDFMTALGQVGEAQQPPLLADDTLDEMLSEIDDGQPMRIVAPVPVRRALATAPRTPSPPPEPIVAETTPLTRVAATTG
jgi:hypothetical protein